MRRLFNNAAVIVLLSVVLSCFAGFAYAAEKAVFIIAAGNFQDDEFQKPLRMLKNSDIAVTVASTTLDQVTGMNGLVTRPNILLRDVRAKDFDAVVFIGGSGAVQYIDDPVAHELASDAVMRNKVVGAICLAPMILCKAGVLKYRKATVYPSEANAFKECSGGYTGRPVEIDGRIVTADGPGSAAEFGSALVSLIKGGNK